MVGKVHVAQIVVIKDSYMTLKVHTSFLNDKQKSPLIMILSS